MGQSDRCGWHELYFEFLQKWPFLLYKKMALGYSFIFENFYGGLYET